MISTLPNSGTQNLPNVRLQIRALLPQLIEWRRKIHQRPELGFQEKLTAQFISQHLQAWEIEHQTGIARTGIVATITGTGSATGKVLAIRADMDALPVQEENKVSYCSQQDGIMHACGHDGHTAIALGTAYYLQKHRQDFSGQVKIIFQPAEEGPGGAKPMIDEGVLKNPDVDAIIGLHLWNDLLVGTVGVRPGPFMAAVDFFNCTILGKGGHGALPHQTIDSVVVAAQIVNALQTIVARNVNPLDSAVVTIGELHAGTRMNVIADTARMSGSVRYFNGQLAEFFKQRITEIIRGICESHGANYELQYTHLYPPVINDGGMAQLVRKVAEQLVETPENIISECQIMGSEDMSFFLQEVPGCYFFLGSANPEKQLNYPHHHPRFDFDEIALAMGVEIFVRCVENFLIPQN